jgi:protein-S-isoprenylcysteine O-methyltransferase Ste14
VTLLFKAAFLVALVALEIIRFPQRARNSRDRRAGKISASKVQGLEAFLMTISFFTLYLFPLLYIFTPWLSFADYTLPDWLGFVGMGLALAAVLMIWRAQVDLGENWSPSLEIVQNQRLVTGGIYRYLRHPIYMAMWLFTIAQAFLLHNWLAGLGGLLTFLPIYLMRVPREEKMMLDQFGEEYRVYMARTRRFFPKF